MFTAQHIAIALKKERLLGRIDEQRSRMAIGLLPLKKPLAAADKLVSGVFYLKERPWIAGAALAAAVVMGRKRMFAWGSRAWTAWHLWRRTRSWLKDQGYLEK